MDAQPRLIQSARIVLRSETSRSAANHFKASLVRDKDAQHQAKLEGTNDARTGMPFGIPKGAMCVQRFDDSLEFCNSHYLSHFAAFFIDARTKRSVVKSFNLLIKFTQTAKLRKSLKCPPGAPARRQGRPGGNRVGQQRVVNSPGGKPG